MNVNEVDVVIPYSPHHTSSKLLSEAISSVKDQSIQTNIIIVFDHHQKGPAWARNVGLKRANNRYLAFLDADDLWENDKLKRQLKKIKQTDVGMCVEGKDHSKKKFIKDIFLGKTNSITSSIFIDTQKINIFFDSQLPRKEDHLFLIEVANDAGVCFCPDIVQIRKQPSGLSSTTSIETKIHSRKLFYEKCIQRVPWLSEFEDSFFVYHHFRIGRIYHSERMYRLALKEYFRSLQHGFYWKTILAILISMLMLLYSVISQYLKLPIKLNIFIC